MICSRFNSVLYSTALLAVFGLTSSARQDPPTRDQVVLGSMLQGLSVAHYQPEKIDDQFSQRVFDLYLKRIDGSKQMLLQPEVNQLKQQYQLAIDDEMKAGTHEFLDATSQLLSKRLLEMQRLYREILARPFDFTVQESWETDPAKATYPASAAEQREQWRKQLKYQTLVQVSILMDDEAKPAKPAAAAPAKPAVKTAAKPTAAKPTAAKPVAAAPAKPARTPAELEAAARAKVLKYYDEAFADQLQTDAADRLGEFANVIANTYDPHTDYLAPVARDNFDLAMSGRLEGTGAQLGEEEGHIKVVDIVAGSASARQGELKIGDYITHVAQGAGEAVLVDGIRMDKVVKLIRGKKGTEVRLTVRRPDGTTAVIPIIRDVVVISETYAQSAVIKQDGKQYGYIRLPGFYADFGGKGGRSSAADVKAELAKLSQQNVAGVILDLRFNGGGSLQDAVEMGGLFVPRGPMVQVRSRQGATIALDDKDPATQYAGPLVILVNRYSASASEILAAAMQDYRRGLVLGSTTYGKGTVQRLIDLDEAVSAQANSFKPLGSLKLTIQKFYRVSGGSTQFKGVVPDIALPDAYSATAKGEQDAEYALPWDEIAPANFQPVTSAWDIAKLRTASTARVTASPGFRLLTQTADRAATLRKQTLLSLNLAAYRATQLQNREITKQQTAAQDALPSLDVTTLPDAPTATPDSSATKRSARFLKPLRKDAALAEAVSVIKDEL